MVKFLKLLRRRCIECGSRSLLAPFRRIGRRRIEYVCLDCTKKYSYQEFQFHELSHS